MFRSAAVPVVELIFSFTARPAAFKVDMIP